MALHANFDQPDNVVGVRELHNRTSELLKRVAAGEELVVTSHGRRVARIVPDGAADPLADLRARGLIHEAKTKTRRRRPGVKATPGPPISELVSDGRR